MSVNKVLDPELVAELQGVRFTIIAFEQVVTGLADEIRSAQKSGTIQQILDLQGDLELFVGFLEQAQFDFDLLFEKQLALLSQQ